MSFERLSQRATSPYLDGVLGEYRPVLDHGFVAVVDYMGNEDSIARAARVSYGKGTKKQRDDAALLRYLIRHRHSSPLEQCEIVFHMKLPIFVARQVVRHRTANLNEISARYSILDKEFYIPELGQIAEQSNTNRQGRGEQIEREEAERIRALIFHHSEMAYDVYEELLNDDGEGKPVDPDRPQLARELSRMALTLNQYTQWYWKIDLHNLLHFLSLRLDPHAQYEVRVYANLMWEHVTKWVPAVASAFDDYRLRAVTFSRQEVELLRHLARLGFNQQNPETGEVRSRKSLADQYELGSERERSAFWKALEIK